jgi:hypothetical protein
MRILFSIGLILMGCGSPITAKTIGEDADSDTDVDADADADADADTDVNPTISFAQALCESGQWTFSAIASDPQGLDTLDPSGLVEAYSGDTVVNSETLILNESTQRFDGSADATALGVSCGAASAHDFWFTVYDIDGNPSEAEIVAGSAG